MARSKRDRDANRNRRVAKTYFGRPKVGLEGANPIGCQIQRPTPIKSIQKICHPEYSSFLYYFDFLFNYAYQLVVLRKINHLDFPLKATRI